LHAQQAMAIAVSSCRHPRLHLSCAGFPRRNGKPTPWSMRGSAPRRTNLHTIGLDTGKGCLETLDG
jgi:hypothetical protein